MSFNVNPPCIAPSKTIITWQFPGQETKKNSQGDDYRVYYGVPASAPRKGVQVRYNVDTFATDSFLGACYADVNSLEPNYKQFNINNVRELPPDPLDLFVELEPAYLSNGVPQYVAGHSPGWKIRAKTYSGTTGNVPSEQVLYAGTDCSGFYVTPGSLRNVQYVFQLGQEITYVLEIYKEGQVIAVDTGDAAPFVSWECGELEECPPNTCSVDCGTYVCCYGSDGISVFNYQKY
jgi:hypothetical protein